MKGYAEISFDLLMEDNMSFVEGTFRIAGGNWRVFIFSRHDVEEPKVNANAKWNSGATGVTVKYPKEAILDKSTVLHLLSACLSVSEWVEVRGPDSISLR